MIDLLVILFGAIGFLYFFILPGLPFLIVTNGISRNPSDYLFVLMYTGLWNYVTLLVGMIIYIPIISLAAPLVLLIVTLCIRFSLVNRSIFPLSLDALSLKLPIISKKSGQNDESETVVENET